MTSSFRFRSAAAGLAFIVALAGGAYASGAYTILPNGWILRAPTGTMTQTDTMPQGAAASPDHATLAVVESGFNPSTLRLYRTTTLEQTASIPLEGAFGRPLWIDATHVLVAGANAGAILDVDVASQRVTKIALPAHAYPTAIATADFKTYAIADDTTGTVRIGALDGLSSAQPVRVGTHVGGLAFSSDGQTVVASDRSGSDVVAIDASTRAVRRIPTGLHPSDVLVDANRAYVTESDADAVATIDLNRGVRVADLYVGHPDERGLDGSSPNALARDGSTLFVSLGAANEVAVVRNGAVAARIPTGWYPTDVVPLGNRLLLIDGKGEGMRANPYFDAKHRRFNEYIASIQYGSIRSYELARGGSGSPQGAVVRARGEDPVVRKGGPIKHVLFIIKENRSYDQVLGDVAAGNGDAKLAWFGANVTPNEHALAARFGLFDNAYASGEVSESGHNWDDAAFANDYVERVWPVNYGDRGNNDDLLIGAGAAVPRNGYLWQAAVAAHVSFRDYGELTDTPNLTGTGVSAAPSLHGLYDTHYVGWNLDYSDLDRVKEWRREFGAFVAKGDLPQLEYMWLPNDHTYASRPGKLTPTAYVATNDYAVGQIVDTISHSRVWSSFAIFIIEDDAQAGPDHVSAQRTTLFVISPYARGGVVHSHYASVGVLRTMELILGLPALSAYDAKALPLYDAFSPSADLRPYDAIPPRISTTATNSKVAYGAQASLAMDFSRADAAPPQLVTRVLAHNHGVSRR